MSNVRAVQNILLLATIVIALCLVGCPPPPPSNVSVPDVRGSSRGAAETAITSAGLTVGPVTQGFSDTVPSGNVVGQDPAAGTQVPKGTSVNLVISKGKDAKASFVVLPSSGLAPLEVQFLYSDPMRADQVASWAWDFDNDGVVDSTDPQPTYLYDTAGPYSVSLTIQTTAGGVSELVQPEAVLVRDRVIVETVLDLVIVENEPELTYVSRTDTELVLSYTGSASALIGAGTIVVGMDDGGYARRVLTVIDQSQTLTVTTENVALNELFRNVDIPMQLDFTPEHFRKAGLKVTKDGLGVLTIDHVTFGDNPWLELNGNVTFDPNLDFDLRVEDWEVTYLKCAFTGRLDVDFDASFLATVAESWSEEVKLIEVQGPGAWIFPAGLPIYIDTLFELHAGANATAEGSATASIGFDSSTVLTFGAEYGEGVWQDLNDLAFELNRHGPTFEVYASANARAYIRPVLKVRIYTVAGPSAGLEPYIALNADILPLPGELEATAGLDGFIAFDVIDLSAIGIDFNIGYSQAIEGPSYLLGT